MKIKVSTVWDSHFTYRTTEERYGQENEVDELLVQYEVFVVSMLSPFLFECDIVKKWH